MASAKGGTTTRRSSSGRSSTKDQQPTVSPARWAGVALVIAAIVGAVMLAMLSPSQPGGTGQPVTAADGPTEDASPSPGVESIDVLAPVVAPEIVTPKDGKRTGEYEFEVTVAVPEDVSVARQNLDLHVYNNGQLQKSVEKPKPGAKLKVEGVRLVPGANALTAVLSSPAGPGPTSAPTTVILDDEIPELKIVSPKDKYRTYEESVLVEVTSEVNSKVTIRNKANKHDPDVTIGPSGTASEVIKLKLGKNRIKATAVDEAGQPKSDQIDVTRLDGTPVIKLVKAPKAVDPPEEIKIVVRVTDADKKPMQGAKVDFTLTAPNQSTQSDPSTTNAKGRAVWVVDVSGSNSPADALELGVTAISPAGVPKSLRHEIPLR